jgi:hypothetical protein
MDSCKCFLFLLIIRLHTTSQNFSQIVNLPVIIQYVLFQESEALIVRARSSPADWSSLLMQCHLRRKTMRRRRPCGTVQPGSSSCEAPALQVISGYKHQRRPKYTTSLSPATTKHKISQLVYLSVFPHSSLRSLYFTLQTHFFSLASLFHLSFSPSFFSLYNSYTFLPFWTFLTLIFHFLNWSTLSAPQHTHPPSPVFNRYCLLSPNRQSGWGVMLTIYPNLIKTNTD